MRVLVSVGNDCERVCGEGGWQKCKREREREKEFLCVMGSGCVV